ncbi:MAG: hypothetical protein ACTSSI_10170, partial [Candidatus Helarchaeota archaeon]
DDKYWNKQDKLQDKRQTLFAKKTKGLFKKFFAIKSKICYYCRLYHQDEDCEALCPLKRS